MDVKPLPVKECDMKVRILPPEHRRCKFESCLRSNIPGAALGAKPDSKPGFTVGSNPTLGARRGSSKAWSTALGCNPSG